MPDGYRALVIGASGAIGAALLQHLTADERCALALGLHRQSQPAIDFDDEASVAQAAVALAPQGPFHLIVNAAGVLHSDGRMPEKKLGDLGYAQNRGHLPRQHLRASAGAAVFQPAAGPAARGAGAAVGQGRQHR